MPQLLLELFSEEIPARMQAQAGRDLARMTEERLKAAGLPYQSLTTCAGPRRLTLVVEGLPAAQEDREEEIKGPRANAPEQALAGFLRKAGLSREDLTERDGVLYARIAQTGRPTAEIVAEMVEAILRAFPWPKSMRWGSGAFRWVRPLKRILCVLDGVIVPFAVDGIASGDLTEGHRFMGDDHAPFSVRDMQDYRDKLAARFVVLDQVERKRLILDGAHAACAAKGLKLVEDEGLLEEVSGLAEWPVAILGDMDPAFLDLPPEVIRTSMRTHQKYFAVRPLSAPGDETPSAHPREGGDPDGRGAKDGLAGADALAGSPPARGRADVGKLAPYFVVVANIEAQDGGAVIAAGNAKVLSARLSDARFFWTEDRKTPLEDRLETLKGVTFHAKLGTLYERVERIEALAREIAPLVGADPNLAAKAARLCKADLGTGMVGEFPELQGIMGGYYARAEPFPLEGGRAGLGVKGADVEAHGAGGASLASSATPGARTPTPDPSPIEGEGRWFDGLTAAQVDQVADAVRDHYKPVGPSDTVPTAPVTVAVALADKLDTLAGFFAIDEKPTGSRDPYALRRAALGVIRLVLDNAVRIKLADILQKPIEEFWGYVATENTFKKYDPAIQALHDASLDIDAVSLTGSVAENLPSYYDPESIAQRANIVSSLLAFFADRLKVLLRDEGKRHDLVDAVFALGDDDLVRIVARVEALSGFLATEDGATLLAGYKRAVNILKAEAKKGEDHDLSLNPELSANAPPEEAALVAALRVEEGRVDEALAAEDFTAAMRHLAHLRAPVDAFFDKVLVNDPDPVVRLNRLRLLTQVRDTANRVADFSLISG